jgi:GDP-L-fucose synthase
MNQDSKIFVAGHRGLAGSAIVRHLHQHGYHNLLLRSHQETDLGQAGSVKTLFERERPE